MAIFLNEEEVINLFPMIKAIEVVEEGFTEQGNGDAVNLPRDRAEAGGIGLTLMGSVLGGQRVGGFKAMGAGKPLVLLYGGEPMGLLAVLEAGHLGQIRTGAATGVATNFMARENATSVGIVGTGFQARSQLEAVCSVRAISSIKAYSRNSVRLNEFCKDMSNHLRIEVSPVLSAVDAVVNSEIVIAITNVRTLDPVVLGKWLEPGTHVNAAGANSLNRRELDNESVVKASMIVVDAKDQAKLECADLVIPESLGLIEWNQVIELGSVVVGKVQGRMDSNDITLFESQGIALEDVASAAYIYERAVKENIGQIIPF